MKTFSTRGRRYIYKTLSVFQPFFATRRRKSSHLPHWGPSCLCRGRWGTDCWSAWIYRGQTLLQRGRGETLNCTLFVINFNTCSCKTWTKRRKFFDMTQHLTYQSLMFWIMDDKSQIGDQCLWSTLTKVFLSITSVSWRLLWRNQLSWCSYVMCVFFKGTHLPPWAWTWNLSSPSFCGPGWAMWQNPRTPCPDPADRRHKHKMGECTSECDWCVDWLI